MADSFKIDLGEMLSGIANFGNKADAAVFAFAEQGALKMQNYAKEHRRWTDRTAHARQRLTGSVETVSTGYKIIIAHGVDYGLWLELANEKKYAIIPETLEYVGEKEIMPGFKRLIERLDK